MDNFDTKDARLPYANVPSLLRSDRSASTVEHSAVKLDAEISKIPANICSVEAHKLAGKTKDALVSAERCEPHEVEAFDGAPTSMVVADA